VNSKSRFYNTFDYFGNKRKVRDWTVIRKCSLYKVDLLRRGETTDCWKTGWKLPELRDKLTILVIVGIMTGAHSLRSQVGIGSE